VSAPARLALGVAVSLLLHAAAAALLLHRATRSNTGLGPLAPAAAPQHQGQSP
jgi:hypothetical protein